MGHRVCLFAAVAAVGLATSVGCTKAPAPLGEALLVVQTDVAVPRRVNRVRLEIMNAGGKIVETREVITSVPEAWPLSFSVVVPDEGGEQDVLVRLRAYPEGHELSAREIERLSRTPPRIMPTVTTAGSLAMSTPRLTTVCSPSTTCAAVTMGSTPSHGAAPCVCVPWTVIEKRSVLAMVGPGR